MIRGVSPCHLNKFNYTEFHSDEFRRSLFTYLKKVTCTL